MNTISSLFLCFIFLFVSMLHGEGLTSEKPSICVMIRSHFRGEREFAERIKRAGNNLEWNVTIMTFPQIPGSMDKFDWVFTLAPGKAGLRDHYDYLALFDPVHHYFDERGFLTKYYLSYTGYLATYSPNSALLKDIKKSKSLLYDLRWYPTVQFRPYQEVCPQQLFYLLCTWGDRKCAEKYRVLLQELAKKSYAHFYGDKEVGSGYGTTYCGVIPYDGESVLETISDLGVCLIIHSSDHNNYQIPSGRIFEAAAASAVIISDRNPFVVENFGESVLYIDNHLSGIEIFEQVDRYMNWIQQNREEALTLARKAHEIFEERFLLENQLLDFERFHRLSFEMNPQIEK